MEEQRIFNLEEFAGGALSEKFNKEMQKVFDNIYDPNTAPSKARTLDIKLKFTPTDKRDSAAVDIQVTPKLAPVMGVQTTIGIGQDGEGKVRAAEHKNQLAGQLEMTVNEETGEILTSENEKVLDLRKSSNK